MEAEKIKKMFMKKRGMEDGDPMMDHKLKMLEDRVFSRKSLDVNQVSP